MVEIGVWKGDLCTELLERFPSLEMLLVDPYHLRIPGSVWWEDECKWIHLCISLCVYLYIYISQYLYHTHMNVSICISVGYVLVATLFFFHPGSRIEARMVVFVKTPLELWMTGVAVDQEQGLSSETLDMATTRTQRYRSRATHMLQVSPEAAHWVARIDATGGDDWFHVCLFLLCNKGHPIFGEERDGIHFGKVRVRMCGGVV